LPYSRSSPTRRSFDLLIGYVVMPAVLLHGHIANAAKPPSCFTPLTLKSVLMGARASGATGPWTGKERSVRPAAHWGEKGGGGARGGGGRRGALSPLAGPTFM